MASTTNPKSIQTPTATTTGGGENRQDAQRRYRVQAVLWVIGLIVFIASAFVMHAHPKPFTIDLNATHFAQTPRPFSSWFDPIVNFPSMLNNPIPSAVALGFWCVFMLGMALIFRLRHHTTAALSWLLAGVFLIVTVMSSAGVNVLVDEIVGRPRPNPKVYHIHLYTPLVPFPTYPSGHTEHDIAYYGFLLYLSFTKPVREWRYRWLLLPLQIYAVFDILAIGYSRVLLGDHWLTDVLGGYLEGALLLLFFIFLYRWTIEVIAKRRAKHAPLVGMR